MTDDATTAPGAEQAHPEGHYVVIERERSRGLALAFPNEEQARQAIVSDEAVLALAAEDSVSVAYSTTVPTAHGEHGPYEVVVPVEPGAAERTVAVFSDEATPVLLLTETVSRLIESLGVQYGLVDLSTLAGLAAAEAFVRAGVPYSSIDFGQEDKHALPSGGTLPPDSPVSGEDLDRYRSLSQGRLKVAVGALGAIDANLVLIPAMVGPDEKLIDFSPGTTCGTVLAQGEAASRAFLLVDTPERGLRLMPDGTYQRATVLVDPRA